MTFHTFFFFKQKTAYEIYQCDWSSDVCSSDLKGHSPNAQASASRQPSTRCATTAVAKVSCCRTRQKPSSATSAASTSCAARIEGIRQGGGGARPGCGARLGGQQVKRRGANMSHHP